MPRPITDPRFGATLRRLRHARGLSLRDLGAAAWVSHSHLSELESGVKSPSVELADHLDRALDAAGELAALVTTPPAAPDPDRLRHALAHPSRLDAQTVAALAELLAQQRRADDHLPADLMLPWVEPQRETVARLAREARGRHAPAIAAVAAEWTQFTGWLCAEARADGRAVRLLDRAHAEAVELDAGPLAVNAWDFRAYVARQRGEWRPAARWSLAAADSPGATRLQRAQNLAHAAYALARCGDRAEAGRLLAQARDLADADDEPQPDTAYWLSTGFLRLGIGLALAAAGDRPAAAEQLSAGLAGLPEGWADAEWAGEYRAALAAL